MSWGVSKRLKAILGLVDGPMEYVETDGYNNSQEQAPNPEAEDAMNHFLSTMVPEQYESTGTREANEPTRHGGEISDAILPKFDKGRANEIVAKAIVDTEQKRLAKIQELNSATMNLTRRQHELDKMNALDPVDYVKQNFKKTIDQASESQLWKKVDSKFTYASQDEANIAEAMIFWKKRVDKMPSLQSAKDYLEKRKEGKPGTASV